MSWIANWINATGRWTIWQQSLGTAMKWWPLSRWALLDDVLFVAAVESSLTICCFQKMKYVYDLQIIFACTSVYVYCCQCHLSLYTWYHIAPELFHVTSSPSVHMCISMCRHRYFSVGRPQQMLQRLWVHVYVNWMYSMGSAYIHTCDARKSVLARVVWDTHTLPVHG